MLDYNDLSKKFTEELQQFDENSLKKWISFDQKRLYVQDLWKFKNEEGSCMTIPLESKIVNINVLSDVDYISKITGQNLASAA